MNHEDYSDRYLREILLDVRSIAMVGASTTWSRPSYFVMKYLIQKGYRVIPVNPRSAGQELLGETVCSGLDTLPEQVDMVDMFRPAGEAIELVRQAIRLEAKVFWMQLELRNEEAASMAEEQGMKVVMNRCPKIEYSRLFGELGWNGINTIDVQFTGTGFHLFPLDQSHGGRTRGKTGDPGRWPGWNGDLIRTCCRNPGSVSADGTGNGGDCLQ